MHVPRIPLAAHTDSIGYEGVQRVPFAHLIKVEYIRDTADLSSNISLLGTVRGVVVRPVVHEDAVAAFPELPDVVDREGLT